MSREGRPVAKAWTTTRTGATGVLTDLLYPRVCCSCGAEAGETFRYFCWDCASRCRPLSGAMCSRCGDPVEGRIDASFICAACRERPPGYDRARSAVRFDGVLREAVHAFKYRDATWLAADLGVWLAASVEAWYDPAAYDWVVPVPLHRQRRRERGYNQAGLLARGVGRRFGVPVGARLLRRERRTETQTRLTAAQRISNVRGAFAAGSSPRLRDRRLLLVDDVMTTGATVSECARCLRSAGARAIDVVTVARG